MPIRAKPPVRQDSFICAVPPGGRRGTANVHSGAAHLVEGHQDYVVRTRVIRRAILAMMT
jgi:hypothetical protein